jgi:hypothetical protein
MAKRSDAPQLALFACKGWAPISGVLSGRVTRSGSVYDKNSRKTVECYESSQDMETVRSPRRI